MDDVAELVLAGERMQLHADRALFWPARSRLLIADLHLGKGGILRAAGIPVPSGGTGHDLRRLHALLQATGARELWVLGDFLHGPRHARIESDWCALMSAHPGCVASLVAGNHDRSLVPDALGLVHLPDDVRDGPFRFRHTPIDDAARGPKHPGGGGGGGAGAGAVAGTGDGSGAASGHVVCGHVHPVVRLPGLPGRHPALVLEPHQTILPAFSAFTGGPLLEPDRPWIACAHGALVGNRDQPWRGDAAS